MASDPTWDEALDEEDLGPVLPRRPVDEGAEMDITPMIDITFRLLIFFLVSSTTAAQNALELPPARHGTGVSARTSVVITVADRGSSGPALVYLGDGKVGKPLPEDEESMAEEVAHAVEQGLESGKQTVLVKAEKGVKHGDAWRVYTAVGQVEDVQLHVAVLEIE